MSAEELSSSEITPEHLYLSRRQFLVGGGALVAAATMTSACKSQPTTTATGFCADAKAKASTDELGSNLTACNYVVNYNNFYEFSLDKDGIGDIGKHFPISPWTVEIGGLVSKPATISIEDLLNRFPPPQR